MIGINQMLIMRLVSFSSLRCLSFCVRPGLCFLWRRPSKIEGGGGEVGGEGGWRWWGNVLLPSPPATTTPRARSLGPPPRRVYIIQGLFHSCFWGRVSFPIIFFLTYITNPKLFVLFPPPKPQPTTTPISPLSLFLPEPLLWGPGHAGTYTLTPASHPSNARSHVLRTLCNYIYNRSYSVRVWWDIPRA